MRVQHFPYSQPHDRAQALRMRPGSPAEEPLPLLPVQLLAAVAQRRAAWLSIDLLIGLLLTIAAGGEGAYVFFAFSSNLASAWP